MSLFCCPPVIDVVNKQRREVKFLSDFVLSGNTLCMLFAGTAQNEFHALL